VFDKAPEASPYAMIAETFNAIEKSGWDATGINWLLKYGLLRTTDHRPKGLCGLVDESGFCFVKKQ
jgi:hypothetical protein